MPTALTTAYLAAVLLAAGSAAAQPTRAPDAAGAEAAVADLVRAWRAGDWATVALFVDPETAADVARDLQFDIADEHIGPDSLRAIAAVLDAGTLPVDALPGVETASDAERRALARVYRWTASLYDDGEPTDAAAVARVLDLFDRCGRGQMRQLPPVLYKPVGASVVGRDAVEVVGRFYLVGPDGQPVPGESILALTPVVWEADRWTVDESGLDRQARDTKDIVLNPVVQFLTPDATEWVYAAFTVLSEGCLEAAGQSGAGE